MVTIIDDGLIKVIDGRFPRDTELGAKRTCSVRGPLLRAKSISAIPESRSSARVRQRGLDGNTTQNKCCQFFFSPAKGKRSHQDNDLDAVAQDRDERIRMRRFKLRTAMIAVAVLAVILAIGIGLTRRAQRLDGLFRRYSREASRLEKLLVGSNLSRQDAELIVEQVHWHDAVAARYQFAAARPWLIRDPNPQRVTCECGYHATRQAKPATR